MGNFYVWKATFLLSLAQDRSNSSLVVLYSAAKAGSDLLVLSYHTTYKLPVLVARASNNYSPCQFPGKLVPLMITNARDNRALPVCGDGMQVGLRTIAGRLSLY